MKTKERGLYLNLFYFTKNLIRKESNLKNKSLTACFAFTYKMNTVENSVAISEINIFEDSSTLPEKQSTSAIENSDANQASDQVCDPFETNFDDSDHYEVYLKKILKMFGHLKSKRCLAILLVLLFLVSIITINFIFR